MINIGGNDVELLSLNGWIDQQDYGQNNAVINFDLMNGFVTTKI